MPPPPRELLSLRSPMSSPSPLCPYHPNSKIVRYLQMYYKPTINFLTEVQGVLEGIETADNQLQNISLISPLEKHSGRMPSVPTCDSSNHLT